MRGFIVLIGACLACGPSPPIYAATDATQPVHQPAPSSKPPAPKAPASAPDLRGTDQNPVAVKVISSQEPKSETPVERESRRLHEVNEKGLTDYTRILADATMGLIVVAILQATLFFRQLVYMRKGLEDARISANAAKDGALAASESARIAKQSMIAGNRAYVHFNGCDWRSHGHFDDDRLYWRIHPKWINTGNTPTRGLNLVVNFAIVDIPIDDDFAFRADRQDLPTIIRAHGEVSSLIEVSADDLEAVQNNKKYLYIWGIAWYRDVFPESPEHITKFCVVATNLTGNPRLPWDDKTNIFDIKWANYHRHYCTDADCDESYVDPRMSVSG
jgi:hypothetical protein